MEERTRFVALAERQQQPFAHLRAEFGISRKTGYKRLGRGRKRGLRGKREERVKL